MNSSKHLSFQTHETITMMMALYLLLNFLLIQATLSNGLSFLRSTTNHEYQIEIENDLRSLGIFSTLRKLQESASDSTTLQFCYHIHFNNDFALLATFLETIHAENHKHHGTSVRSTLCFNVLSEARFACSKICR